MMHGRISPAWSGLGAGALGLSALLLLAFPIVRPFYDDLAKDPTGGALTLTSPRWVLAHVMLILALVLLPFGLMRVYTELLDSAAARIASLGMVLGITGSGLFLPVGGVDAFALPAIARLYLDGQTTTLDAVEAARSGLRATVFAPGLVGLAAGGVLTAISVWRSKSLPGWAGIPFAVGLVFFFPLFPQMIRVGDGVLTGIGGLWLAAALWMKASRPTGRVTERVTSGSSA